MNYNSIIKGLDEAVKISKGELSGRKQKVTIRPVKVISKNEIKTLRDNLSLTQSAMAEIIGVSKKTIEAWEKGTNKPNGPALRFMGMLKEDPELLEKYNIVGY